MIKKDDWDSVWEEHFPDEDEKLLKNFFIKSLSETCRGKLGEEFAKTKAEIDSLHSINKELLEKQENIEKFLKTMDLQTSEVQESLEVLKETKDFVRKCNKIQSKEIERENVDDLVEIRQKSHKKMLDLILADEAIKDSVYALGQLLNNSNLPLETYLKKVRDLSRKQFLIRQKMIPALVEF